MSNITISSHSSLNISHEKISTRLILGVAALINLVVLIGLGISAPRYAAWPLVMLIFTLLKSGIAEIKKIGVWWDTAYLWFMPTLLLSWIFYLLGSQWDPNSFFVLGALLFVYGVSTLWVAIIHREKLFNYAFSQKKWLFFTDALFFAFSAPFFALQAFDVISNNALLYVLGGVFILPAFFYWVGIALFKVVVTSFQLNA